MATIGIDIFEKRNGERRVVGHTFFGSTPQEAKRNLKSHRKSDRFFDAALSGRSYKGLELIARRRKGGNRRAGR